MLPDTISKYVDDVLSSSSSAPSVRVLEWASDARVPEPDPDPRWKEEEEKEKRKITYLKRRGKRERRR